MSALKVVVSGSTGRMGQELLKLIKSDAVVWTLVGEVHRSSKANIAKASVDVVVDFSLPELFEQTLQSCVTAKVPLVSGTTGHNDHQLALLQKASKDIPIFWAANMSLGVAVFQKMLSEFKSLKDFDFHIHEVHHNQKKDKPSGTALALHANLQSVIGRACEISSERGGGVFGVHTVKALGKDEVLAITHEALNRTVFSRGALKAAQWLVHQRPGLYGMNDLLS